MNNLISRLPQIEIPKENPFMYDQLNRHQLCETLSHIIDFYGNTGCVMSLNGEWGSGKTTFVKMWKQTLENTGYKTLYFNAWESDFTEDPLMALVTELTELAPTDTKIKKITTSAVRLSWPFFKQIIKRAFGIDIQAIEEFLNTAEDIGEKFRFES